MARPYVVQSSAVAKAPLAQASAAITDPANYPRWFRGAHSVQADGYPQVGGKLAWRVKWLGVSSSFAGVVVRNELPARLVMHVRTPSGLSAITHAFEAVEGGTRYTKTVEVADAGPLLRLMMASFLPRSVKAEVEAAARLLDK